MEIEVDKRFFPIPRNIDHSSIKKEMEQIYGVGKNRRLKPGEEALIMETIHYFIKKIQDDP